LVFVQGFDIDLKICIDDQNPVSLGFEAIDQEAELLARPSSGPSTVHHQNFSICQGSEV
jgi:hypothetical protein